MSGSRTLAGIGLLLGMSFGTLTGAPPPAQDEAEENDVPRSVVSRQARLNPSQEVGPAWSEGSYREFDFWLGEWDVSPGDRVYPGDFDGDDIDEVYIRTTNRVGVIEWAAGGFDLWWTEADEIGWFDGRPELFGIVGDVGTYSGQFLEDRDGIIHRYDGGIAVLHWLGGAMKVRHDDRSWLNGQWNLGTGDTFVLGRFLIARH